MFWLLVTAQTLGSHFLSPTKGHRKRTVRTPERGINCNISLSPSFLTCAFVSFFFLCISLLFFVLFLWFLLFSFLRLVGKVEVSTSFTASWHIWRRYRPIPGWEWRSFLSLFDGLFFSTVSHACNHSIFTFRALHRLGERISMISFLSTLWTNDWAPLLVFVFCFSSFTWRTAKHQAAFLPTSSCFVPFYCSSSYA